MFNMSLEKCLKNKNLKHLVCSLVVIFSASVTNGASLPAGFAETVVVSGLNMPTAMTIAPDGRIFVCQQSGQLRVIKNGSLLQTPFISLNVNSDSERGLLGVALDPNFASNQFVYLYYTTPSPSIHNRISRFTANGDVVASNSEVVLLELDNVSSGVHNGGAIHFGPDGKLYAAVGDNANRGNAQDLSVLFGKILRINSDGTIPTDNPFYNTNSGKYRAIWSLGLRNPFTFAFQRGTSLMFINDVGENTWEEINNGQRGANYGWGEAEGPTTDPRFVSPTYAYDHNNGCSITGGSFYNPVSAQFPASYSGDYFFADYCGGWIRVRDASTGNVQTFATGINSPVDIKVGDDGSLYYLARDASSIFRVRYTANQAPTITGHPQNRTIAVGQSATFTCSASGTAPISYQWQRNGSNIPNANSSSYTIANAQVSDNNSLFSCLVSNPFGNASSNQARLTVAQNSAPVGTISQPSASKLYQPGETISYSGTGTDGEDGNLPNSAFTWRVDFHHDDHVHPFMQATSGATSGTFVIPMTGENSRNVFYRTILTVRDSAGLTHTSTRDIYPAPLPTSTVLDIENSATLTSGQAITDGWALLTAGYVEDSFNFVGSGSYTFKVRARGDFAAGAWPIMELRIDQVRVASISVNSATWAEFSLVANVVNGAHRVALAFVNDSSPPSEDRNLYLDTLSIVAPTSNQTTYLSDMQWTSQTNGWGPVEKDRSNGEQGATDGRTITLNGVTYAKGLGVHANSEIKYNLGGTCTSFMADVGIDDEASSGGSIDFRVYGDGALIYESGSLNGSSPTKSINVDVSGKRELRLVAAGGTDIHYDHGDWANARVVCSGSSTGTSTYLSDMQWTSQTNGWGPPEKDRSNGEQGATDGRTITLNGVTYAKGLGVHANSEIKYNLGGNCTSFMADVGIDDEVSSGGSIDFRVYGDGALIYESGSLNGSSATKSINVDVSGKRELRLVAASGADIHSDHGDWANARIICSGSSTGTSTYLSDMQWTSQTNGWGPAEKDRSNGEQGATDGRTITLNGVTHAKGLGVHANSEIKFSLSGNCTSFIADVGIDDEVASGSIDFRVYGDGALLYSSGSLSGNSQTKAINIDISGKRELTLRAEAGDDIHSDHGDWASARVICVGQP